MEAPNSLGWVQGVGLRSVSSGHRLVTQVVHREAYGSRNQRRHPLGGVSADTELRPRTWCSIRLLSSVAL